jgi:glycosyltransferase involved in cell wall biosynthesis
LNTGASTTEPDLELSIVAPAHNEQDNVDALVREVGLVLSRISGGDALIASRAEFIIVDDGSTDQTRARVRALMCDRPWLRCVAMQNTPPGRGNGQSAAFFAGFRAARGKLIAVLDADLQNDPADLPSMIDDLRREKADMVQGDRSAAREDNAIRRVGSLVGRVFRRGLLDDPIRDTGCSLRVMKSEVARAIPLQFKGVHRFIPITAIHLGYKVIQRPVHHRPRVAGETKYGLGIVQRALPGLLDLLAVKWMRSRRRPTASIEVGPDETIDAPTVDVPSNSEASPAPAAESASRA